MKITEELERLTKLIEASQAEIAKLTRLSGLYPDLEVKNVHRQSVRCSALINSQVTTYYHTCPFGERPGNLVKVWPYVETSDGNVYSEPPCFTVAEVSSYGGALPYKDWETRLREQNISDTVIRQISRYFDVCHEKRIAAVIAEQYVPEDPDPII